MSFDWSEYLYLAQEATNQVPSKPYSEEARLRAAISRGYYAAFCETRRYLTSNTIYIALSGKDTHWDIINQFISSSDGARRTIGRDLLRLFENRKKADYDDVYPDLSLATAQALVNAAQQVIIRLSRLK